MLQYKSKVKKAIAEIKLDKQGEPLQKPGDKQDNAKETNFSKQFVFIAEEIKALAACLSALEYQLAPVMRTHSAGKGEEECKREQEPSAFEEHVAMTVNSIRLVKDRINYIKDRCAL